MRTFNFLKAVNVTVELEQPTIFLAPPVDKEYPQEQPLHGTIHLKLTKPRRISRIVVKLEGSTSFSATARIVNGGGSGATNDVFLSKEMEVCLGSSGEGELLDKGLHSFRFSFMLASSLPPTQKCIYGDTRYSISAYAQEASNNTTLLRSSTCPLHVVSLPLSATELEPSLATDEVVEVSDATLGPVVLSIFSPHLTVASLVELSFTLASPPTPISIISVAGVLQQSFRISYPDGKTTKPPPQRCILFSTCSLATARSGERFETRRLTRLLNDGVVLPTTTGLGDAAIRVSHLLGVELRYQVQGDSRVHLFSMFRPVTLASCHCPIQSINLPIYTPTTTPSATVRGLKQSRCVCTVSTKELESDPGFSTTSKCVEGQQESEFGLTGGEWWCWAAAYSLY